MAMTRSGPGAAAPEHRCALAVRRRRLRTTSMCCRCSPADSAGTSMLRECLGTDGGGTSMLREGRGGGRWATGGRRRDQPGMPGRSPGRRCGRWGAAPFADAGAAGVAG